MTVKGCWSKGVNIAQYKLMAEIIIIKPLCFFGQK